jgi:sortase B
MLIHRVLLISSIVLFVGCSSFLIYYLILQPQHSKKVTDKYRQMYYEASVERDDDSDDEVETYKSEKKKNKKKEKETETIDYSLSKGYKKGAKDKNGVLLKFSKLVSYNSDIKGWLKIPDTKIDYPVLKSFYGSDFYLYRDIEGNSDKNGCLYLDYNSEIKPASKNIVIHGHNMETTGMMFSQLPKYRDINFYKEHPVITFDTIYKEAQWKVIALLRVSGQIANNGGFNYMQGSFEDDNEFLDFLYQIEARSLYHCPVDVNENDRLLMLSTCTYEVNNYRTVVVARKIRKGESKDVNTSLAEMRENVLYPDNWYEKYEGEAPPNTNFRNAMAFGEIDWYDGDVSVDSAIGTVLESGNCDYKITSPTTATFVGCNKKKATSLTIPSSIKWDGRKFEINKIAKNSFDNLAKLKYVKIGNKVTSIPSRLFINCTDLEDVILGDSIEAIGKKAFWNVESLKKIKIRGTKLTTIEEKAFKGIANKAKIKIPDKKEKKIQKIIQVIWITGRCTYRNI